MQMIYETAICIDYRLFPIYLLHSYLCLFVEATSFIAHIFIKFPKENKPCIVNHFQGFVCTQNT